MGEDFLFKIFINNYDLKNLTIKKPTIKSFLSSLTAIKYL